MSDSIYGYTANLKMIKSRFDADTWHDNEYYNLDLLDAVLGTVISSLRFKGFWANNTEYLAGDTVLGDNILWIVQQSHTTDSSSTFTKYYEQYPSYYFSWNGITKAREWAIKLDGMVEDGSSITDYSSKAYAISEGLITAGSAKEWAGKAADIAGSIQTNLSLKQDKSNLVTSINASSTDTQYPSAKCMYDIVGNVEALINAL